MVGALLLVLSSLAADKLQLPGTAEQQKAVDAVREIYGDQWRAATTAQEKTALVRKLIADADGTKDDAAGRFVLLRTARDMAAQIGDVALVREACEKLEAAFHVGDMRTEALKALGKSVRGRDGYTALTELALDSLARDIEAERFDSAEACLSAAEESVRRTGNSTLARRVADERKKLDAQAEAWAKAEEARKVLEDSATDPEANEVVGRYLCFVRGDWERGLPHLALATDSQLVTRAADDLKRPTDPEAQVALGDAWWDLDEGRERGAFWYRKALPQLTGLAKARVEKRLQELAGVAAEEPVMKYFAAGQRWVGINTHTKGPEAGNGVLLVTLTIAEMRGNSYRGRFEWRGLGPNGLADKSNGENVTGTRDGDRMTWRGDSTATGEVHDGALLVQWRNGNYSGEAWLIPQALADSAPYVGRWSATDGNAKEDFVIGSDMFVARSTMPSAKAMIVGSKSRAIIGWSNGHRAVAYPSANDIQLRIFAPAVPVTGEPQTVLTLKK